MNKSRQEKTKTPAQPAAAPPASNDIIPGRFTETDWHNMLEQEDGEEFAVDIVNEIVESTMRVLHEKYIISQTLPYTIQETKILLLQIIEWQFLACDLGEENPACDSTWLEEDEPVTPITDSWAQGSVPVLMRLSSASSSSSVQSDRDSELPSVAEQRPGAPEPPFEALEISETPLSISSPAQPTPKTAEKEKFEMVPSRSKVQVQDKKRSRAPFKPHKGKLPTFSGVDLTSLTDDYAVNKQQSQQNTAEHVQSLDQNGLAMLSSSTSILKRSSENSSLTEYPSLSTFPTTRSWCGSQLTNLKAQQGRPPGVKDVLYDDRGNVVAVMKISPDKLPSHRVRTRFSVVDDDSEGSSARTHSRPRKLRPTAQRRETDKPYKSTRYNMDTGPVNNMPYRSEGSGEITPLPPPLVDTMDLSTGVVVREGKIVRRGPRQIPRRVEKTPSTAVLQPLDNTRPAGRVISDILTRSSPVIRPLRATEPIPPIAPHPPTYS